jgi:hypothetical protein
MAQSSGKFKKLRGKKIIIMRATIVPHPEPSSRGTYVGYRYYCCFCDGYHQHGVPRQDIGKNVIRVPHCHSSSFLWDNKIELVIKPWRKQDCDNLNMKVNHIK